MDFCHIAPTKHLSLTDGRNTHLVLAHLIENDEQYVNYYLEQKKKYNCTLIMDNSAFEMYKQKKSMYDPSKLIDMGKRIKADYIVLSDYPGEYGEKTIQACNEQAPKFKEANFKTFFVPQGQTGNISDLLDSFHYAVWSQYVDYIGVSILAAPLAYNVESGNNLQRFNSRLKLMYTLGEKGLLDKAREKDKLIHFLGMLDGPNEIMYMHPFAEYIDTWDSSAAVWLGLNDQEFDDSPTGIMDGKFEKEVDFDLDYVDNERIYKALKNMNYIDKLCEDYLE